MARDPDPAVILADGLAAARRAVAALNAERERLRVIADRDDAALRTRP